MDEIDFYREKMHALSKDYNPEKLRKITRDHSLHRVILRPIDVFEAHVCILQFFDHAGAGYAGLKVDPEAISSVCGRQLQYLCYGEKTKGVEDRYIVVASLIHGIITGHPFMDANKRTSLLCMLLQLERMRRQLHPRNKSDIDDFVVNIANSNIKKSATIGVNKKRRHRGRAMSKIPYIAKRIMKLSRVSNYKLPSFRWRDLIPLLRSYGFDVRPTGKGFADIVKTFPPRRGYYSFKNGDGKESIVLQVAYHGDNAEVPKNTLQQILSKCGLTKSNGYDVDALMRRYEPGFKFIEEYKHAFRKLASR